jgi:hypothetical protein
LAGAVLVPSGVLFIILGWYGAAHASYVQQQIPYLASGVGVGLACVALGASLYWSHWIYRVYDQADLHHAELVEQSERHHQEQLRLLEDALAGSTRGRAATARSSRATEAKAASTSPYLATASGTSYHVADCPILSHHGAGATPLSAADVKKMKPCRICASGAANK